MTKVGQSDGSSGVPRPGVYLHAYAGRPPSDDIVRDLFGLAGGDFLYMTATAAQARSRVAVAPQQQRDPADRRPHIVFHEVLRLLLDAPLLTRTEQRVLLQRAADALAANDVTLRRQLRHDAEAWADALADLDASGIDATHGVPQEVVDRLTSPALAGVLEELQRALRAGERDAGRLTFEHAARRMLDDPEFVPPPTVVMEGFTFLTPLQRHFIERCRDRAAIHLVFPWRPAQDRVFRELRRTYNSWWQGPGPEALPSEPNAGRDTALAALQERLFALDTVPLVADDGSVTIAPHLHRHHEVAACMKRIAAAIHDGVAPSDIAIVTRNPGEYQALLQEEAALHGVDARIGVPPRLLLLTPLGRFVLALYEVREEGSFALGVDHFQTIVTSGWLGARVQASADRFQAVNAQLFARCSSMSDWQEALDALEQALETETGGGRVPSSTVRHDDVRLWRTVLEQTEALSARLFGGSAQSIGGHVRQLLEALEALSTENLFEAERTVVERIREGLAEVADAATLAIDAAEFGQVLAGLARQYDEAQDTDADRARTAGDDRDDAIAVTTPEGIDGASRRIVLYLGVDDHRVPRGFAEPWPCGPGEVDEHSDLERYMFAAVVRAATDELHFSYTEYGDQGRHAASPFLEEVRDIVQLPASVLPAIPAASEPATPEQHLTGVARRDGYTLAELAQYRMCPFRYKLERLDRVAASYRDDFQVGLLAQAVWLEETLRAAATGEWHRSAEEFAQAIHDAKDACESVVWGLFDGVRPLRRRTVREWVGRDIDLIVQRLEIGTFWVRLKPAVDAGYDVIDGDRVTYVAVGAAFAATVGKIEKVVTRDVLRREWLLWKWVDLHDPPPDEQDLVQRYRVLQWTNNAMFYAYAYATSGSDRHQWITNGYESHMVQVASLVQEVEAGNYPRRPGVQCTYCPALRECLGLDP